jgi:tRNA wybutosine-synthesizing protein 1
MNPATQKILEKQHYRISGNSAVQICRWAKKSLLGEGYCYKQKFYGIQSHRCCQMTPCVMNCQNQCLHCWRPIELNEGIEIKNAEKPEKIIENCIEMQKKLLMGFKGHPKVTLARANEAMNPKHFAISLSGEPTLYPYLGKLIELLRKRKITSFLVTNGLNPKVLEKLGKKKQLPTQLYLSVNAPNEEIFNKITRSKVKNAWQIYLKTLKLLPKLKTRKVLRLTLIKDLNMGCPEGYASLIRLAEPDFVEVKGFMSVGFSRQRLGYERMPFHTAIKGFAKKLAKASKLKILDEKKESCVVLLGKNKSRMGIKNV